MRTLLFALLVFCNFSVNAQEKKGHVSYNKLVEVSGTDYVIASFDNYHKKGIVGRHILFINTRTGFSRQVDLGERQYLQSIEQIKIDSIGVNRIVVVVGIYRSENEKDLVIDSWRRILVFSPDGSETLGSEGTIHFANHWLTNNQTGSLVITGYTDSDGDGRHDQTDKNEILVYDLKNMKIISKI